MGIKALSSADYKVFLRGTAPEIITDQTIFSGNTFILAPADYGIFQNLRVSFTYPAQLVKQFAPLPFSTSFESAWLSTPSVNGQGRIQFDQPSPHIGNWPQSGSLSARRSNENGFINASATATVNDTAGSGWSGSTGVTGSFTKRVSGSYAARISFPGTPPGGFNDLDFYLNLADDGDKLISFYTASNSELNNMGVACFISTDGGKKFSRAIPKGNTLPYVSRSVSWAGWKKHEINLGNIRSATAIFRIRTFLELGSAQSVYLDDFSATVDCNPVAGPQVNASGSTALCTGGSLTLTAASGTRWLWSTGETTQSIEVSTAGSYTVQTISGACTSAASAPAVVTVTAPPATPAISAGGPVTFNSGGSVVLTAGSGSAWLWSNGQTTQSITVSTAGSYTVQAIAGTCTSAASLATVVTVNAGPQSLLVGHGQQLTASGAYANITVENGGELTLTGDVAVNGQVLVKTGGTLQLGLYVISGSGGFTLQDSATLGTAHADGISTFASTGALQLTGTRSLAGNATYVFNGSTFQNTGNGLPAAVANLTINNSFGGVNLTQVLAVTRLLTLQSGQFFTSSLLTLASNASGTAMVVNIGGTTVGNVKVQRYISPSIFAGSANRYISAPVSGQTLAGLLAVQGSFAPVLNTAYNTAANPGRVVPFPNVFGYDFNRTTAAATGNGWFVPTGMIDPLKGYSINAAGGTVLEMNGDLNSGDRIVFGNNTTAEALLFVGNPFPSPINFDLFTRMGIYNSFYTWQPTSTTTGRYASYVNGVGTNGATNIIPMGVGFFVSTSRVSPMLMMLGTSRVTSYANPATFRQQPRPLLRLALAPAGQASTADETVVYFDANANASFDGELDAKAMPTALSLFSQSGGVNYAINALPASLLSSGQSAVIALGFNVPATGTYRISTNQLAELGGATVHLIDQQLGTSTLLEQGDVYDFQASAGSNASRFLIQINAAATALGQLAIDNLSVYPNPAKGMVDVSGLGPDARLSLVNSTGQVVQTATASHSARLILAELPAGVYSLHICQSGQLVVKRLLIE